MKSLELNGFLCASDMKNKLFQNLILKNPFLMETLLLRNFSIFSTYFLSIRFSDMCGVH